MRIFVDCEFNGFGGELISMALVAADGAEWYEVKSIPSVLDPWVAANVIPILGKEPIGQAEWRESLHAFLLDYDNPTIVADWYTDLVHFFASMAGPDHTMSLSYACRAELILLDKYDSQTPHNALSDARAIRMALVKEAA